MAHDEEEHESVQKTLRRVERRTKKRLPRMPVAGRSVFVLKTLLRKRATARRTTWRRKRRKH